MDQKTKTPIAVREDDASQLLGVSTSTLRAWRSQGRGPEFSRLGRRIVYTVDGLEKFVRLNTVATEDQSR
jgi:hypothetical protein